MDPITSRLEPLFGSFPEPVLYLFGGRAVYSNEPGSQLCKVKPARQICSSLWQSTPAGRWRSPWARRRTA